MTGNNNDVIVIERDQSSVLDIEEDTLLPQRVLQEPDSETLEEISTGSTKHEDAVPFRDNRIDATEPGEGIPQVSPKTVRFWTYYLRDFWLKKMKNNPFMTALALFSLLCILTTFYYFIWK
ncbi:unnamed protein product [Orchesella dallaii]|uniref:Otoferlin n=1 Tax=Orchesella dallaii TaxID=48710 RepID=A0ABP1RZ76_9HEXA